MNCIQSRYVFALLAVSISASSARAEGDDAVKNWRGRQYDEFVGSFGLGVQFASGRDIRRHDLGKDSVFVVLRNRLWISEVYYLNQQGKKGMDKLELERILRLHFPPEPSLSNLAEWVGKSVTQFQYRNGECRQISNTPFSIFAAKVEGTDVLLGLSSNLDIQSISVWNKKDKCFNALKRTSPGSD